MERQKRRPSSPGEILEQEFLVPYKITEAELAKRLGVEWNVVKDILRGGAKISVDLSIRLGLLFGMSSQFWLNLQTAVDRWDNFDEYKKIQHFSVDE